MVYLCPCLNQTLIEAAKAGAAEIVRFFNSDFKISNKEGVNNLVTEADHAAEKAIIDVIKSTFPDHHILSEETGNCHRIPIINGSLTRLMAPSILPMAFRLTVFPSVLNIKGK